MTKIYLKNKNKIQSLWMRLNGINHCVHCTERTTVPGSRTFPTVYYIRKSVCCTQRSLEIG